jgi:glycosyltransferase involved in cell wall biosynthesis
MTVFSIITVTLNSACTVRDTVQTVRDQIGVSVQHIIKDGGSTDDTLAIVVSENPAAAIIRHADAGIYDAMNQGFCVATGDYVGFLNSDDYYAHEGVLQKVLFAFSDPTVDIVYGDIQIIDKKGKILRYWKCQEIMGSSLAGRQLPHPAFFVRREVLAAIPGPLDPSYRSAADFKQQLLLIEKLKRKSAYVADTLTVMRAGGASTRNFNAIANGWFESARAYREVHDRWGGVAAFRKVVSKFQQGWR